MKLNNSLLALLSALTLATFSSGCPATGGTSVSGGGAGGGNGGGGSSVAGSCVTTNNGSPVSTLVNGASVANPGGASNQIYFFPKNGDMAVNANIPMVTITICLGNVAGVNCATVPNILLDTGSYGLRVFKTAMKKYNAAITMPATTTADCAEFGSGASWGAVEPAFVTLGGQVTSTAVPIQVIDTTFGAVSNCVPQVGSLFSSPSQSGFNGILGVGPLVSECVDGAEGVACACTGGLCTHQLGAGIYYSCPTGFAGGACTPAAVAQAAQVSNPVAFLPATFNNGISLSLPTVGNLGGPTTTVGYVTFGIPNFVNAGIVVYPTTNVAEFATNFTGTSETSILDSGSNGIYLPNAIAKFSLDSGWAIPSSLTACSGINIGQPNAPKSFVNFQVANADQLFSTSNVVFSNLIGDGGSGFFDWGLPFFLGRNVFIGLNNSPGATINNVPRSGPYWAY